ncbi:MAG: hypothetical protein LPK45_05870 [Bacteroidota bacterium]|nr:hypothetical protein [Bacteroidota bacterium]MDX5430594.1 hypothetical protein [Bacteroidota bacterium]MDX5469346.1 hypothetical protein [Bacteroidota bacterium]
MSKSLTYGYLMLGILLGFLGSNASFAQCPGSIYAGEDTTICFSENRVFLNGRVVRPNGNLSTGYWTNFSGRFDPDSNTLSATYIPSEAEVNAGFVDLVLLPTQNCNPSKQDTVRITIRKIQENTVSGPSAACEYSSGNTYSVTAGSGLSYDWQVVGGYISSGAGTNSISVTWGSKGPGYIYVVQSDTLGCYGVSSIDPIGRFHFNTPDLLHAELGSDATSVDSDVETDGVGFIIESNCNATKGLDLSVPGTQFNRGKLSMTFSWQRDESDAVFFSRSGNEFYISGGNLYVKLKQYDSSGTNPVTVGPINTGYSAPNDNIYRYYTLTYDSASGIARVLVNDSIVWNYQTGNTSSLYWVGAGAASIGANMDGNCVGLGLIDWVNFSIPVSIYAKPETSLSGTDPVCRYGTYAYSCDTPDYVDYSWSATNGAVASGQTSPYATITWNAAGSSSAQLLLTDTRTGCDSSFSFAVTVNDLPTHTISGDDSLCVGDTLALTIATNADQLSWSNDFNSNTSTTVTYSVPMTQSGSYLASITLTDTSTGCVTQDSLSIEVQAYPTPDLSAVSNLCFGESAVVQVSNTSGVDYTWTATGGSIQSGQGTSQLTVNYSAAGNYTIAVVVTDSLFGCSVDDSVSFQMYAKPVTSPIYH